MNENSKEKKIKIPPSIQFRIYLSLVVTLILFISVYVALYFIGFNVGVIWWESPTPWNWGRTFVVIGLIPLAFVLFKKFEDYSFEIKDKKNFSKLYKSIEEVSKKMGMEMPHKVELLPTESIHVSGIFKKKLVIGIVGLRSITVEQFKSILAHELGHLYGKDTIIGGVLGRIQLSLEGSSKFGKDWWDHVPFVEFAVIGLFIALFAKIYSFFFRIILSIYGRQVEYRADYISSQVTSKEVSAQALVNYSAYCSYFGEVGYNSIVEVLEDGRQFINVYDTIYKHYRKTIDTKEITKFLFEGHRDNIFSSHPSLKKRLKALGISKRDVLLVDKKGATTLLGDSKPVEKELTLHLTNNLHANLLYMEAVEREGRCRYCGEQFKELKELLEHEERCGKKPDD